MTTTFAQRLWLQTLICSCAIVVIVRGNFDFERTRRNMANFPDPDTKEIYEHLKQMEGFKLVGYIPTAGSGVTIATGVDLGQWTAGQLGKLGVPAALIQKFSPYLGLKTRAQVEAAGLNPSDLKITEEEAWELDRVFLAENEKILARVFGKLSVKGRAVLVSLRHWNGALKNSFADGKLTREVDGHLVSYVWEAVKDGQGTDPELLEALRKTRATFTPKTTGYNRLGREADYLE